jgi:predicted transcriptional regulator
VNKENILISLEPRHAENILIGTKRVELRRRQLHVEPGTVVWMYSKLPKGSIVGRATVLRTHKASPQTLWRRYGNSAGVSRAEFFAYFFERGSGFALELSETTRLSEPVTLKELRKLDSGFQPPQFFKRLNPGEGILQAMASAI